MSIAMPTSTHHAAAGGGVTPPPLRRDLRVIGGGGDDDGSRHQIVWCDVSDTFTRVPRSTWSRLWAGGLTGAVIDQAVRAGWTRHRSGRESKFSPFAFSIPLGSIDGIAKALAGRSDWVFGGTAVLFWSGVIVWAALLTVAHAAAVAADVRRVPAFLAEVSPLFPLLIFWITKLIHELGHAVMCRRLGSRCGDVGVMMLMGMPCPYCDVTDVWRNPSTVCRGMVMLAGIYVELIVASIAALAYLAIDDPVPRLLLLNVMLICGVSTVLFNANPLMRYDGYYVLMDWIDSVNLRVEAMEAFRSGVLSATSWSPVSLGNRRQVGLVIYHLAASVYRMIVLAAMAGLIVVIADGLRVRQFGLAIVVVAGVLYVRSAAINVANVIRGVGPWRSLARRRRGALAVALLIAVVSAATVPLPRRQAATGRLDAADTVAVYLPASGVIDRVHVELGDVVAAGDALAETDPVDDTLRVSRLRRTRDVARLSSVLARQSELNAASQRKATGQVGLGWDAAESAVTAADEQLQHALGRRQRCDVAAAVAGRIVPSLTTDTLTTDTLASDTLATDTADRTGGAAGGESIPAAWLRRTVGSIAAPGRPWCRIATSDRWVAVLSVDAKSRSDLTVGTRVRLTISGRPGQVVDATVCDVSLRDLRADAVTRQADFEVRCELIDPPPLDFVADVGSPCRGVFELPGETLWQLSRDAWQRWIDG